MDIKIKYYTLPQNVILILVHRQYHLFSKKRKIHIKKVIVNY